MKKEEDERKAKEAEDARKKAEEDEQRMADQMANIANFDPLIQAQIRQENIDKKVATRLMNLEEQFAKLDQ